MWLCLACLQNFENPKSETISISTIRDEAEKFNAPCSSCPNCGCIGIVEIPKNENISLEMSEYPNCPCHVEPFLDVVMQSSLSFDDMDINEKLLLDLPVEEVVPITYITEMNSRFLHTFVDGCFVPV